MTRNSVSPRVPGARMLAALVVLITTMAGCAVQLSPPYDPAIEQDTAELHKQVELFFQQMISDPSSRGYASNRQFYIDTLASMNNLAVRSRARWSGGTAPAALALPGGGPGVHTSNEEAEMFDRLVQLTENIQQAHKQFGFSESNILIYRDQYRVAFTSILQYESFLRR